jgi:Skp family chaperone for outer membrane proteins
MESMENDIKALQAKLVELETKLEQEKQRQENERSKQSSLIKQLQELLSDRSKRRYTNDIQKICSSISRADQPIFSVISELLGELKFRVDELWEAHPPVIELRKKQL